MARHNGAETVSAAQPRKARRPKEGVFMALPKDCPASPAMPRAKVSPAAIQQGPPTGSRAPSIEPPANNTPEKSLANAPGRSLIEVVPRTPFAQAASCRHARGPMCHRGGHAGWRGTRQFPSSGKEGGLWVEFVPCVAQGPPLFFVRPCTSNWRLALLSPSSSCEKTPHAACPIAHTCGRRSNPVGPEAGWPADGHCGIHQKTPEPC